MNAYDNPAICSIIKRTRFNLEFIDKNKTQNGPFEATQLLNSIAGLLVYPMERLRNHIEKVALSDPCCVIREKSRPKVLHGQLNHDTVPSLLRYLRNAFAHFNTDFEYEGEQIKGVYVWNKTNEGEVDWVAYLSMPTLRYLIEDISELFLSASKKVSDDQTPLQKVQCKLGKTLKLKNPESRQ